MPMLSALVPAAMVLALAAGGWGLDYPYAPYAAGRMDPQLAGWPLTDAERAWVLRPEYERKPGHEATRHLPDMWPVTPTAGYWGGEPGDHRWLDLHARLVAEVEAAREGIDLLLLGDSITQHWGGPLDGNPLRESWRQRFPGARTVNAGIAGDRIENVLWRLEHGALAGSDARAIVLLIGVNDIPLVQSGVSPGAIAAGIALAVASIREKRPQAEVVLVGILPFGGPGDGNRARAAAVNADLAARHLDSDPRVHVLDLWNDMVDRDGVPLPGLLAGDRLHLSEAGYALYAEHLQVLVAGLPAMRDRSGSDPARSPGKPR